MKTTLAQKTLLKGSQEFQIVDDAVKVHRKPRFREEESFTVMLAVLNSEPVINKSTLDFTSRVNSEPLLSLFLANPDQEEFNAFVSLLKHRIQDEYSAFAGLKPSVPSGMEANQFEEAPDFDDVGGSRNLKKKPLKAHDIGITIDLLKGQLDPNDIPDFLGALEDLKEDPDNIKLQGRVAEEFGKLGPLQGAVLAYGPYMIAVLSDDPYENL